MTRRDAILLLGTALTALAPTAPEAACYVFPPDGVSEFLAVRGELVVGRHRLAVSRGSGVLVVRSETSLELGLRGGGLYRLVQRVEETWREGWLWGLVADTNAAGRLSRLRASRDAQGVFGGVADGLRFAVSGYPITTTLWNRDTPTQQALLDVADGRVKLIRGWLVDQERIGARGATVAARHYAIAGELDREVWYDADCLLVRAALFAPDGARIVLELQ